MPKLRVWVPSVVSEKRRWIARSSSQNYLLKTCLSVDSWGSLSSSVSYLSSVLEGERIWVSFITFLPSNSFWVQLSWLLFNSAVHLQHWNRAEGEPKWCRDGWWAEQGGINWALRHEDLVSHWDACHNSDAWIWKGMPSSFCCEDRQALWAGLFCLHWPLET